MNYAYIQGPNYEIPMNGSNLNMTPLVFRTQLYPKIPYYTKEGQLCTSGCGATSKCVNGICKMNPYKGTVFDGEVIYGLKK